MHQLRHLMLHCFDDSRVAVTQHVYSDTRHEIKVDFAVAVPDSRAFATHECKRLAFKGRLVIVML